MFGLHKLQGENILNSNYCASVNKETNISGESWIWRVRTFLRLCRVEQLRNKLPTADNSARPIPDGPK